MASKQPLKLVLRQILDLLLRDGRNFDVLPAERDLMARLLEVPQELPEHDDAPLRPVLAACTAPPR